jgi:hypothetical protein
MPDIIPATNDLALGPGWGPIETHRGESFRWVENNAVLYFATLKRTDHQVKMTIEPGPGVGLKAFTLHVLDGDVPLTKLEVRGRQPISFIVPAGEPVVHTLKLHVDEGGKTAPNDPRVLNFRVFQVVVHRLSPDVLPPGFRVGTGWYPLETYNGESFRWINNDAVIEASQSAKSAFNLEVEPGPGLEMRPFVLQVLSQTGTPITTLDVRHRQQVEIKLPSDAKLPMKIKLHVDGGGKTSPGDPRTMNFRAFEYDPARDLVEKA